MQKTCSIYDHHCSRHDAIEEHGYEQWWREGVAGAGQEMLLSYKYLIKITEIFSWPLIYNLTPPKYFFLLSP